MNMQDFVDVVYIVMSSWHAASSSLVAVAVMHYPGNNEDAEDALVRATEVTAHIQYFVAADAETLGVKLAR